MRSYYIYPIGIHGPSEKVIGDTVMSAWNVQVPSTPNGIYYSYAQIFETAQMIAFLTTEPVESGFGRKSALGPVKVARWI